MVYSSSVMKSSSEPCWKKVRFGRTATRAFNQHQPSPFRSYKLQGSTELG